VEVEDRTEAKKADPQNVCVKPKTIKRLPHRSTLCPKKTSPTFSTVT